ncbi:deoxyribodipyrimidine photo-lyase [Microvirga vignae]|uniref:deoxyribodipyrimidine photo-lyase n=1 Tax=Microvirga vignae TaxID=1225564 RepID=UPI000B16B015
MCALEKCRRLPVLVWFRDDHRLGGNSALSVALETGTPVLRLAIMGEPADGLRPLGGAARW